MSEIITGTENPGEKRIGEEGGNVCPEAYAGTGIFTPPPFRQRSFHAMQTRRPYVTVNAP